MKVFLTNLTLVLVIFLSATESKALDRKKLSYEEIEKELVKNWAIPYGIEVKNNVKGNIFTKPLEAQKLKVWNDTLTAVKSFVLQKSHNNKTIDKTIDVLLNLSNSIENTIKLAKNSKAVNKSTSVQREQLAKLLESLQKDVLSAKKQMDSLKKETFILNRSDRIQARKLLEALFLILESIAQKTNDNALIFKP